MALARVQSTGKVTADNQPSVALTFAAPPAVGNGIVVGVLSNDGAGFSTTACTDNRGNTYLRARVHGGAIGSESVTVYYCPTLTASGSPFTVTIAPGVGNRDFVAVAIEVGGVGSTGLAIDAGQSGNGIATGAAVSILTVSTPQFFALALVAVSATQTSIAVSVAAADTNTPGWSQEAEELTLGPVMAGEIDSRVLAPASGTVGAVWTWTATGWFAYALVAFKPTGAALVAVPDVVGDLEADATTAITGAGLTVGAITTATSESVPAGHVISQSPAAGAFVALGTAVALVVSTGSAIVPGLVIKINGVPWTFRAGSMTIHSTLNGRDTLSGVIDILDGADPPTLNQEITVDEDGVRNYGGTINELEYRAITSDPDASQDLMVSLSAEDFNALADKRTVPSMTGPEGLTLKQALQQLLPELTPFGIALSPTQVDGPILPSFTFTLQTATAILEELSKLSEFVWEIDYAKVLTMWQPGSVAAPFNITDGDQTVWGDIVIRPIASDYANRIIVRTAGEGPSETVFAWYTDGTTNYFPMYYYVLQHFGQVLVDTPLETVPGEGWESVGPPGSGALWEFHDGPRYTQYLSRTAGAPPTGNLRPAVPYPIQFRVLYENPVVVTADDLAEQAAHGIVEQLVTVDGTGSWWELQAYAESLLARHASRRYTVQYSTREQGLRVGQSQTIAIARRHLSGPYFITDVDTQMVGATILKRTVTANETELFQGSWRDTYKLWAGNSGGGGGGASMIGTTVPLGTPGPHHAQHEPGGMDPMTVDSTAAIGSLRTLGPGANQAAPGNDARFSTPALHHATHEPGGSDVLQLTAAARLLGRATAGAGPVEELTVGDNLYVTGTTLSAASRNSAFVNYSYSTATSAPPGAAQIRFDAGAPYTAVTKVWIRTVTADGQDVYRGLLIVPSGSTILVQDKNDHTKYVQFTTTGTPLDFTTYVEFPVVHQAHGSALGGGQLVIVQNTGGNLGGGGMTTLTGDVTAGPGGGSQVATIAADAVTYAKLQNVSAASKLIGRGSASGSGDAEEITLGTNLSMSGTTLSATGGSGGKVAQFVSMKTGTLATGTTTIPIDNTIPQQTEGDQYLSLAITPTNAASTLVVDVDITVSSGGIVWITVALFRDSGANALGAVPVYGHTSGAAFPTRLRCAVAAGSTSATTFKVRAGASAGSSGISMNGSSTTALLGGVIASGMTIAEVLP